MLNKKPQGGSTTGLSPPPFTPAPSDSTFVPATTPPVGETEPPVTVETDPPVVVATDPPVTMETDPPVTMATNPPIGSAPKFNVSQSFFQTTKWFLLCDNCVLQSQIDNMKLFCSIHSVQNPTSLGARPLIHLIPRMNVLQLVNLVILGMENTVASMPVHVISALPRRDEMLGSKGW